jgi:cation diffusion facilitator family transporter
VSSEAEARRPSHAGETKRTVNVAIAADLAIAVGKLAGGLLSGSVALLAEAAHSVADTGNQVLLRVSLSRGEKAADEEHPFGYGRERFFWALLVAVLMFVLGAIFSISEGALAFFLAGRDRFVIAYAVLAVALVADSVSLARALFELRAGARRQGCSLRGYLRASTDPTLKSVLFEDVAAVTGVVVAVAGVLVHQFTGRRGAEAVASIVIGCGLAYVAFRLGKLSKDLLIGRPALPSERQAIRDVVVAEPAIENVTDLRTMHIGPTDLLVAIRVEFCDGATAEEISDSSDRVAARLRRVVPDISDVYLDSTRTASASDADGTMAAGRGHTLRGG